MGAYPGICGRPVRQAAKPAKTCGALPAASLVCYGFATLFSALVAWQAALREGSVTDTALNQFTRGRLWW